MQTKQVGGLGSLRQAWRAEGGHLPSSLVIAHKDPVYAALICRTFRTLGWDVHLAESGPEVRRLARCLINAIVVLDANLTEESGWLTCEKLLREHPGLKVILVDVDRTPSNER